MEDTQAFIEKTKLEIEVFKSNMNISLSSAVAVEINTVRSLFLLNGGALFLLPSIVSVLSTEGGILNSVDIGLTILSGFFFVTGILVAAICSHHLVKNMEIGAQSSFNEIEFQLQALHKVLNKEKMTREYYEGVKIGQSILKDSMARATFYANTLLFAGWVMFAIGCFVGGVVIL